MKGSLKKSMTWKMFAAGEVGEEVKKRPSV